MCSFSQFYFSSPDGVKALIVTLPWLTIVASVWLWTRRRHDVRVVPLTGEQFRTAVACEVAMQLRRGNYHAVRERDDTSRPQRLNPPEDQEED